MPNSNNASKRHRQNLKRRIHNRSMRSRVRTSVKSFETAIHGENKELASSKFAEFVKLIDTAACKGLYHKNTAARKKSRLHKKMAALT